MAYTMFDDAAYDVQQELKKARRHRRWSKFKSFLKRKKKMKNLSVSINHWNELKKALEPSTPFRKKPIRMLLEAIENEQRPWWKLWG